MKDGLSIAIDPSSYTCPSKFDQDYLCYNYLRKWRGWKEVSKDELEAAALLSFKASELQCERTNLRLRNYGTISDVDNARFWPHVEAARRYIVSVIGNVPPDTSHLCDWGPGATFDLVASEATLANKVRGKCSITMGAVPYLKHSYLSDPLLANALFGSTGPGYSTPSQDGWYEIVPGNRHTTVPKDCKTNRNICVEPTGNLFLQKGVGTYIRLRLFDRAAINLDDQSVNQTLAKLAYHAGYATIDLSNASDTVSYQLVKLLLPDRWFELLSDLRCSGTRMNDGKWYLNEKFSSMGNGFTFELESLIFWSLAKSLEPEVVSVFGDDIVVSGDKATELVQLLDYCGFTVNSSKSYLSGPFYESCGKHYFHGVDCSPIFEKESYAISGNRLETEDAWYRSHNRLYRYLRCRSSIGPDGSVTEPGLTNAYEAIVRFRPSGANLTVPDSWMSDGARLTVSPLGFRRRGCLWGRTYRVIQWRPLSTSDDEVLYLAGIRRSQIPRIPKVARPWYFVDADTDASITRRGYGKLFVVMVKPF